MPATTDQSSLDANSAPNGIAPNHESSLGPRETDAGVPTLLQVSSMMQSSYGTLLRLVRSKLRDRELAADLLNEAVAISLEHVRSGKLVKVDQGLPGYVFKVSMNLARNYRRNKDNSAEARTDSSALDNVAGSAARDDIDDQRLRQLTRDMLASLNMARDRQIVERFYLDEVDKDTICRDLGVTAAQFNLVISRARQRMKRLLDERGLGRNDLLSVGLGISLLSSCHLLQLFETDWSIVMLVCAACL